MLECLNKVVDRIDIFQEDCSKMIFALRHLIGEDQVINEHDFFLKEDEDGYYVYRNNEKVLSYNEEGTFAQPKFSRNTKLIKEATKFLKKSLNESGGTPADVSGTEVGGKGGTSVADIPINPNAFAKKRKTMKEASTTSAVVPKVDANTNQGDMVGSKKLTLQPAGSGNYRVSGAVDQGRK